MKIGIFDSGHGGRLALEKCRALLPEHDFIGFFDHANAPYGDRSPEDIYDLTETGMNNLFDQKCKIVLLACNTASARGLRKLQEAYPQKKVLGCLVPAIQTAIDKSSNLRDRSRHIGVLATRHTVESKKYQREAFKVDPLAKVFPVATPKLVPWIETYQKNLLTNPPEKGELKGVWPQEVIEYLQQHIQTLIDQHHIDTLILGCTHYSALKSTVEALFPQLKIIDSAQAQAEKLVDYLEHHPELK